ncbi:unnamed protein product [Paramecium sonneborni]|uniref:Uncharacterized protein n=1 Tax=Paramecium sonneborni TaxID=65129 RepID=A0A8S1K6F4_9CILI|nr:unnamed protein product [Paramecium sonneborni]
MLIQEISINKAQISIAISENQLIGVFLNSRQINVLMYHQIILNKLQKQNKKLKLIFIQIFLLNQNKQTQKWKRKGYEGLLINDQSNNKDLISFTNLEEGRWVSIQNIAQIRESNRVKLADVKMPFFLDFRNTDVEKQNI